MYREKPAKYWWEMKRTKDEDYQFDCLDPTKRMLGIAGILILNGIKIPWAYRNLGKYAEEVLHEEGKDVGTWKRLKYMGIQ